MMGLSSLEPGLEKNPRYWFEVEFLTPRFGRRPDSTVMDVLANDWASAESLALACGPSGGVIAAIYQRGTSEEYRSLYGQDGEYGS